MSEGEVKEEGDEEEEARAGEDPAVFVAVVCRLM